MAEDEEGLIYTENLRMRGAHLAFWTVSFLVFVYISLTILPPQVGVGQTLFKLLFTLCIVVFVGFPAVKFWIARITVEITTDGLYVRTKFPSGQRQRLFGWEQLTLCTLQYWPVWGYLGDRMGTLFTKRWSCGGYVVGIYRFAGFKPLFGEREVCFTINENGKTRIVVLNTNNPVDFVRAVEQAMHVLRDESFSVMIENKMSFFKASKRERPFVNF
jgi:hypothetical protein